MQKIPANELLAGLTLAEPVSIHAVVTDSRKVEPGCVFVCFPGERVDGHDFAAGAYRDGAAYINRQPPGRGGPGGTHRYRAGQRPCHDPHGRQLPDAFQPQK